MKKLTMSIILMGAVATASAQNVLGTIKNQAGGKIVLLEEPCAKANSQGQRRAFFWTSDNYSDDGCWKLDNGTVVVEWDGNGRRRYPTELVVERPRVFSSAFRGEGY